MNDAEISSRKMPKRQQQRIKQRSASTFEKYQKLALDEARLVQWPKLMRFVEESLRWELFQLWIRAVVNAADEIPPLVEEELERRIPGLLATFRADLNSSPRKQPLGEALWNCVGTWVLNNVMLQPRAEGWSNAVNFFASRTMTYMKVWAYWERVNRQWRTSTPAEWPSYERWQSDAAAITQLPNADGEPQYILDAINSVPSSEWERMLAAYRTLVIFGIWLELVLDLEGSQSAVVARSFTAYPGFAFSRRDLPSSEAVQELLVWGIENVVCPPSGQVVAALTWHIQGNPEYYGIREYAIACHHQWSSGHRADPPSFTEWREQAARYSVASA